MKLVYSLIITLLVSLPLHAQQTLTLEEAIKIALQRNSSLIKSKNNLKGSKANIKSAYGQLLPNLSASGSWNWNRTNDDGGTQLDFFGNPVNIPASQIDSRNYSVRAGGSWTLFDGLANFANIAKQKKNYRSAKYALIKQKQDLVLQTTQLYYAVLSSKELLKVREDNLDYNKKLLEEITEKNKLGAVTAADLYTQKVAYGNAQLLLIQAQNNYEQAVNNLLNFLALDILEEYTFQDPYPGELENADSYMKEFSDVEVMVAEALKERPDYKSQKLLYKSKLEDITIARSGFLPSLSSNYGFSTSATRTEDLFNRRIFSVGLSLNIPIFTNFRTETQLQLAKISVKNAQEDINALERQIKIEIKQGYLDLIAAKKQLEVSLQNVKAAEENRRINKERYNLGAGKILDVMQADRDYTQAVRDKIVAEYEFYRLKDNLLNALGKLDIKNYE